MTIAIDLELPIVLKLPVDVCIPIIIGSKKFQHYIIIRMGLAIHDIRLSNVLTS